MEPRKFLELAHDLHKKNTEAAYRSAISRAYYGAFHKGSEIIRSMNIDLRVDALGHEDVSFYLQNSGARHMRSAGSKLDSLRVARSHADYRLYDKEISKDLNVQIQIREAEKIIQKLETPMTAEEKERVKTKVKNYIKMRDGK